MNDQVRYPEWRAPELGLIRATVGAVIVTLLLGAAIIELAPGRPKPPPITVTRAQIVTLPPPPPPPPEVVQPPTPLEAPPIAPPPPAPAPARVQVQKPPPKPVHRVIRHPPRHVVPRPDTPPPPPETPTAPPVERPPPPAPAQVTSGVGPYASGLHDEVENNVDIPPAIQQLGVSGTAVIRFTILPNGRLSGASVVRSSGNPLIDQAALAAVRRTSYRAFTSNMPSSPLSFSVPIEIAPGGGD